MVFVAEDFWPAVLWGANWSPISATRSPFYERDHISDLARQSQVKAEVQELTQKMPGVCSGEVHLPVCETPHIHSSQHSHHHVASGSGRAICIDKEMSACIIWKCVIVFIHTQTQRCMWNLYPVPREPALWGNVCQTEGNCDASPQSNKRMFNVHSCSECIKSCLRAAGV